MNTVNLNTTEAGESRARHRSPTRSFKFVRREGKWGTRVRHDKSGGV